MRIDRQVSDTWENHETRRGANNFCILQNSTISKKNEILEKFD